MSDEQPQTTVSPTGWQPIGQAFGQTPQTTEKEALLERAKALVRSISVSASDEDIGTAARKIARYIERVRKGARNG